MIATPGQSFGEGLAKIGKYFHQLTYQDQFIYQYESDGTKKGTKLIRIFASPLREGWGLITDGKQLIASDGNAHVFFLNPETLKIEKTLRVFDQSGQGVMGMNELEYVNGQIYANIFPLNQVIRFDATSGCENGVADLSELSNAQDCRLYPIACEFDSVLNGIAYDTRSQRFFMTGKSWPLVFVGQFY